MVLGNSTHDRPDNEDSVRDDDRGSPPQQLKKWVHEQCTHKTARRINGSDVASDFILVRLCDAEVALETLLGNRRADEGRVVTVG